MKILKEEIKLGARDCINMYKYINSCVCFIGAIYECEDQKICVDTIGDTPLYNIQVRIKGDIVASYWCDKYERSNY